jgi:transposase
VDCTLPIVERTTIDSISSLLEMAKLNCVHPLARPTDVLTKFVNLRPASRIDALMPWDYVARPV